MLCQNTNLGEVLSIDFNIIMSCFNYMSSNHLEELVKEFYEYNGYFVRTKIKVDKRKEGG